MEWIKKHWYIAAGVLAVGYFLYKRHQATVAVANAQAAQQNALANQEAYALANNAAISGYGGLGVGVMGGGYNYAPTGAGSTNALTTGSLTGTSSSSLTNALASIASANQAASNTSTLSSLASSLGIGGGSVSISNTGTGSSLTVTPNTPAVDPVQSFLNQQALTYFQAPTQQTADAAWNNAIQFAQANGVSSATLAADAAKAANIPLSQAQTLVGQYAQKQGVTLH